MLATAFVSPGDVAVMSGVVVTVIRTSAAPRASTRRTHTAVLGGPDRATTERPLISRRDEYRSRLHTHTLIIPRIASLLRCLTNHALGW